MVWGRWWPLSTVLVYAYLVGFTWMFTEGGAHAAQRLSPRSMGSSFEPMRMRKGQRGKASGKKVPYRRIRQTQDGYRLEYGFKNFNGDKLTVKAKMRREAVAQSVREFGYKKDEFGRLDRWYETAQKSAIARSKERYVTGKVTAKNRSELASKMKWINEHNDRVSKECDRELDRLAKEYRRRRFKIYDSAGFRFKSKGVVEVDIPEMVRRNWKRVRGVAMSFADIASKRRYDAEDLVGSVTAMVQTSLRYEIPDSREGSRVIAGVLPPPKTLVLGQGDCDTKTALLASVLMNWPNLRMVGLGIPGHYLMAVHRIPRSGEVYVEYQGLPYVMIESAGPAWLPPGQVGDSTMAYLDAGKDFRIQPLKL